jgi:hypothetical protein
MAVNWGEECARFAGKWVLQEEACSPGLYVYRPSGEFLACYPGGDSLFVLNFCLVSGRTRRGQEQTQELTLQPLPLKRVRDLIEAFASLDSGSLLKTLEPYPRAEPGMVSTVKRRWLPQFLGPWLSRVLGV